MHTLTFRTMLANTIIMVINDKKMRLCSLLLFHSQGQLQAIMNLLEIGEQCEKGIRALHIHARAKDIHSGAGARARGIKIFLRVIPRALDDCISFEIPLRRIKYVFIARRCVYREVPPPLLLLHCIYGRSRRAFYSIPTRALSS